MSRVKTSRFDDVGGESFPEFADGDVKLTITGARQYQLHSGVLKNASPVMRDLLANENAAPLSRRAVSNGIVIRHKLVLVHNPDNEDDEQEIDYVLEPVPLDAMGRPSGNNPVGVGMELEEGRRINPIFMAYDAVLGAMYNQPINLGDSQQDGLSDLLSNAFQVTVVSEYLDCIRIVSKPIEATLLATGQNLNRAIASNPVPWLTFAARVRSRAIFKEALIHAAGQFNQPSVMDKINRDEIPADVLEVLVRKGRWVQKTVSDSTRYLASYYPSMLLREVRPGDKDNVSRASYGNDIVMWIAVCIFRHWICDLMASDRTHHAPDMGWAFVNAVCMGGDIYLSRQMLQHNFHVRFPMTSKGMACVEHRLAEIKDDVKQWAVPLKINNSSLDLSQMPVSHFLHINVNNADFPWVAAEEKREQEEKKPSKRPRNDESEEYEYEDNTNGFANGTPPEEESDDEMLDLQAMRQANSSVSNPVGAGDDEYDTETNTEDEEREMVQSALSGMKETKLKERRPGDE
ncbi:hypothetical protein AC578_1674 [Pseudocercospora eumusae]|uniref:BTB domain-containing protein n=1 Tax=Pseudocercospora eumusae TaxID=321146 RepID=A0A139GXH9_9PEZI|nr:hypothetical protein AC578_1674 [Pseudocercospora eumusae]